MKDKLLKKIRYDLFSSGFNNSNLGFFSDENTKNKNLFLNTNSKDEKNGEKIKFGQKPNFSFFESNERNIIFQIFDNHLIYFFNFRRKKNELTLKNIKEREIEKAEKSEYPHTFNDTIKKEIEIKDD